jgi:hypothetical protein
MTLLLAHIVTNPHYEFKSITTRVTEESKLFNRTAGFAFDHLALKSFKEVYNNKKCHVFISI